MKCKECGLDCGHDHPEQYYESGMVARITGMSAANVRHNVKTGKFHYSATAMRTESQLVILFSDADIAEFLQARERLKKMGRNTWGLSPWLRNPKQLELL